MTTNVIKYALLSAFGVALYVWGVVSLMTHLSSVIPTGPDTVLAPMFMLLLFVISAATTGFFVLGRPILLYLNGNKREAVLLFLATTVALMLVAAALLYALSLSAPTQAVEIRTTPPEMQE